MRRRDFIGLAGSAVAWPLSASAQSQKLLRVGIANVQPRTAPNWVIFERRMAELGYEDGRNFVYDHVQIPNVDVWESLCREMVARKPDILVAAGPEASLKAARATAGSLPIVMIAVDYDPIAKGHAANLARPGGNITGLYYQTAELAAKHLQLMKEIVPTTVAATVFWDQVSADYWAALQAAAPNAGIQLKGIEFRERPYDYERAMAGLSAADRQFLIAIASPFFFLDRAVLAETALRHRIAMMGLLRETVAAGTLITYGASNVELWALAADYVDRIAKGAKPADLPIQQPTKFELVINLKTARALGLEVPLSLLARADEVIE